MAEGDGERKGFLGRWASRKSDALKGKPLDEPVLPQVVITAKATIHDTNTRPVAVGADNPAMDSGLHRDDITPPLTLDDVMLLTKDSDFKPFMAPGVGPKVRNAAMKKLFADPHFNVMDGLDIYIDDYSKSDPIPESMLRQMTSAKFLKIFDDDEDEAEKAAAAPTPRETANNPADQSVAQSIDNAETDQTADHQLDNSSQPALAPNRPDLGASQKDHDHTDLRLQPDHAAPAPEAGRST